MRVDYRKAFPAGFRAMAALERAVHESTLEPGLLELVKIGPRRSTGARTAWPCTLGTRGRAASTRPGWTRRGLARGAVLHRSGARGPGLVRGADRTAPYRRSPRGVRRGRGRVLRNRDRRADLRDRGHQRLEPARRRAALGRHDPRRPRPSRSAEPGRGVRPISSPRASASYQYRGWPGMLSRSARTRARSSPSAMSAAAAKAWSVHSRARPGSPATAWARASAS